MTLVQKEVKRVMMYKNGQDIQVRPEIPNYLCFTANTAGSTIQLAKNGNPTSVTLETSTDGSNWSAYTIGSTTTLSSVGDKIYFRNSSTTTTGFSTSSSNYYRFALSGSVAGSGDINYLLNKNSVTTVSSYCYYMLFYNCASLTSLPSLTATTIGTYCYMNMFDGCTNLTTLPKLPATTLPNYCYYYMFNGCSNIKLSTTQTSTYKTEYRIPEIGTGTAGTDSLKSMFLSTGGTFKSTPSINTTYYTSNTVV